MKLPSKRGLATIPRYGSGYMYQFSHIYLLQQELLNKRDADWFRALELWHTARHEGIALNVHHYNNILQHCAIESSSSSTSSSSSLNLKENVFAGGSPWYVALDILRQMRRDALRADCKTVSLALSVLANHGRWEEAVDTFSYFSGNSTNQQNQQIHQQEHENEKKQKTTLSKLNIGKFSGVGVKMDSICVAAVIRACLRSNSNDDNNNQKAEEFVKNLRSSSRREGKQTQKQKMEPGKNPKFSSSSTSSSSVVGITNSVDEITIETALNELQAFANEMKREYTQQNLLESQEVKLLEGQEHFMEEKVPVLVSSSSNNRQKQHEKVLEQWNNFFEKVRR